MATITPAKPPVQADFRAAKQLLGLFPWMAQLWSTAVREAGAGSIGRYRTLRMLHGRGPIRAGELATRCGTTPSAISEVIEGLVTDGHVRRVDDPTDRRAVGEFMTAAMVRVFDGLTTEQKSRLRSAIGDLNEILINPSAPSARKETRHVR